MRLCFGRNVLSAVAGVLLCAVTGTGQPVRAPAEDRRLKSFLQDYAKPARGSGDKTVRYRRAFIDLSGQRQPEAIVYLNGADWCGSGGCTTLVLARLGLSYRLITKIPITRLPIRVLGTRSNGWHDIGVWVRGGGILPGYEADLSFDGRGYPSNPSVFPSRRSRPGEAGVVVLSVSMESLVLYP